MRLGIYSPASLPSSEWCVMSQPNRPDVEWRVTFDVASPAWFDTHPSAFTYTLPLKCTGFGVFANPAPVLRSYVAPQLHLFQLHVCDVQCRSAVSAPPGLSHAGQVGVMAGSLLPETLECFTFHEAP
jgi:hypothetical protein